MDHLNLRTRAARMFSALLAVLVVLSLSFALNASSAFAGQVSFGPLVSRQPYTLVAFAPAIPDPLVTCDAAPTKVPGPAIPSYGYDITLSGRLLVWWREDLLASAFSIYAYDLGPNERLEVDRSGNPAGDDRGPFLIESNRSNTTKSLFPTLSMPRVGNSTIVYFRSVDRAANGTIIGFDRLLVRRSTGLDGLIGTTDDTDTIAYNFSYPCPYPFCIGPNTLPAMIHGDIISWTTSYGETNGTGANSFDAFWCSMSRDGQSGGCLMNDQKNVMVYNRSGVGMLLSVAREGPATPFNAIWLEGDAFAVPNKFGELHARRNTSEYLPFSNISTFVGASIDLLRGSAGYFLFDEIDTVQRQRRIYLGQAGNPALKVPISVTDGFGGHISQSQGMPGDPGLIAWAHQPSRLLMVSRFHTSGPALEMPVPGAAAPIDGLAVNGRNIAFVYNDTLFLTRCS